MFVGCNKPDEKKNKNRFDRKLKKIIGRTGNYVLNLLCIWLFAVPCQFRAPCCDKAAQREETVLFLRLAISD